jgi:hypothetical protein
MKYIKTFEQLSEYISRGEIRKTANGLLQRLASCVMKKIGENTVKDIKEILKDMEESKIDWNKDVVISVREKYKLLTDRAKKILKENK